MPAYQRLFASVRFQQCPVALQLGLQLCLSGNKRLVFAGKELRFVGEQRVFGYRSIVLFRKGERCFFVYGFPKSELGNIGSDEKVQFKKMAKHVLALTEAQLAVLLANGQFEEVVQDD